MSQLFQNIKRLGYIAATTPVVLVGVASAASATDPTTVGDAVHDGISAAQVGALAVGLGSVVTGLLLFAAPEAVTFGKKMYKKARS